MTKAERLEFIRKKYRQKHPFPRVAPKTQRPKAVWYYDNWGVPTHPREVQKTDWLFAADPKPKVAVRPKRTARKSPLTKIAEQLPWKVSYGPFRKRH